MANTNTNTNTNTRTAESVFEAQQALNMANMLVAYYAERGVDICQLKFEAETVLHLLETCWECGYPTAQTASGMYVLAEAM